MSKQIRISPKAHEDISKIFEYIKKDGEQIAKSQVDNIYNSLENLAEFPNMGVPLQKFVDRKTDYKILIIKKVYIAVYNNGDYVDILRVFRKGQDFINALVIDE